MYEDEYLDAAYEDQYNYPDDDYTDDDAERDHDFLLERQEMEDFENHYGPCNDYDVDGDW